MKKGKNYFWGCLQNYSLGLQLFSFKHSQTAETELDERKILANPQDYDIVLGDIVSAENEFARKTQWLTDTDNSVEIDTHLVGQGIIKKGLIDIVGDIPQGIRMREQLHYFGLAVWKNS